jgi:hypothetical protein
MVTGLAAWFHAACLLFLKEVYQLGNDGLFDAESFLTGMCCRRVDARKPG